MRYSGESSASTVDISNPKWLSMVDSSLQQRGYAIVHRAFDVELARRLRTALYRAQDAVLQRIGHARLERAGEIGVVRIPFLFDAVFFDLLESVPILSIVDRTVGSTAILHLMNGFVWPSSPASNGVFQSNFHRDFPRYLNGYMASINIMLAVDDFTPESGATLAIPGAFQTDTEPDAHQRQSAISLDAPSGSLIAFDSTLWHSAGSNSSGRDRLSINMQFTKSFIKQQIDYVRALGDDVIQSLAPRSQQLLGWYTRVVTSLEEYYVEESDRLYRRGQG